MFAVVRRTAITAAALFVAAWATAASAADVFIQSEWSGSFVRLQRGVLHANADPDQATRFEMVRLEGSRVAFRAPDGSFVRAGIGQRAQLGSRSPHIRGWETFEIVREGRHTALRSVQNGKYVEADPRSGTLAATAIFPDGRASLRIVNAPRGPGAGNPPPRPPRFEWTGRWTQMWLASPNGDLHRPPAGSRARFVISANHQVEMTAGCNTLSARLRVDGNRIRFDGVTSTRVRCANAQQGYERGMAQAFEQAQSFEYREGQVAVLDRRGRTLFQIGR